MRKSRKELKRELKTTKELLARLYFSTEVQMFEGNFGVCAKCGGPRVYSERDDKVWRPSHFPWCIYYEVGDYLGVIDTQVHRCSCYLQPVKMPASESITTRKD